MIKRLIFDLDNTLIMWKKEYTEPLRKTLEKFHIDEDLDYVNSIVENYEQYYDKYDKENLLQLINDKISSKIDINFINCFLDEIGCCGEYNEDIVDTLNYLKDKYELVVLTNWFTNPQINRLKSAHIFDYFKDVIGGEEFIKPNKKAFLKACGNHNPSECIMIGDDYSIDIIGADMVGINTIYLNHNRKNNKLRFKEIYTFSDLKNIL